MTEYIFGQIEVEAIENPSYQLQITTHYCPLFPFFVSIHIIITCRFKFQQDSVINAGRFVSKPAQYAL